MANYNGTTASSGGTIKKGKEKELQAYLDKWGNSGDGDLKFEIRGNSFGIYGYDDFDPHTYASETDPDNYMEVGDLNYEDNLGPNEFLGGLVPFLEVQGKGKDENLIVVHTVGAEKCRFPLGACEYILRPTGKVDCNYFKMSHA